MYVCLYVYVHVHVYVYVYVLVYVYVYFVLCPELVESKQCVFDIVAKMALTCSASRWC